MRGELFRPATSAYSQPHIATPASTSTLCCLQRTSHPKRFPCSESALICSKKMLSNFLPAEPATVPRWSKAGSYGGGIACLQTNRKVYQDGFMQSQDVLEALQLGCEILEQRVEELKSTVKQDKTLKEI